MGDGGGFARPPAADNELSRDVMVTYCCGTLRLPTVYLFSILQQDTRTSLRRDPPGCTATVVEAV